MTTITEPRPRVLFVGAFTPPPGTSIRGGQLAACQAVITSPLTEHVEWVLLDSMMESIPPPPLARRAFTAARRLLQFVGHMLRSRVAVVMIFSSSEMSILEKGAMAVLGRVWRKRVVFCPRSGYIVREWRQQWWFRRWLRRVILSSDAVVCQGRCWREFFAAISGLPLERFPIIYNIAPAPGAGVGPLPSRERAERALLMGWVERNKGIFDLVEMVDRFRVELDGMRFVIGGKGVDLDELMRDIERRGLMDRFEFRGWVDEAGKERIMADVDICLMLSHREGMPNALIEAMAAGRPVIATAAGAVSDIVEDGRTGFLCEPRDVEEIGFRLLELRRDRALRERLGAAGRRAVQEKMAGEVVWRNWLDVLVPPTAGKETR